MRLNLNAEKSVSGWAWRCAFGPAMLIDGLLYTVTAGTFALGLSLVVARRMAMARLAALSKPPGC